MIRKYYSTQQWTDECIGTYTYIIIIIKPFTVGYMDVVTALSHDNLYTSALGIHVAL